LGRAAVVASSFILLTPFELAVYKQDDLSLARSATNFSLKEALWERKFSYNDKELVFV
jgi:hypothetical protein